jgi:hypothetical protein
VVATEYLNSYSQTGRLMISLDLSECTVVAWEVGRPAIGIGI